MEAGSLLTEALQYMHQLHVNNTNHDELLSNPLLSKDYYAPKSDYNDTTSSGNFTPSDPKNALLISLYVIDSIADIELSSSSSSSSPTNNNNYQSNKNPSPRIKVLLQKLAKIHSYIHNKILPTYKQYYQHQWFMGGEGLSFGIHCNDHHDPTSSNNNINNEHDDHESIPHLRAIIRYGPHPLDEYYALSIVFQLTIDLQRYHNIRIAASCWDLDDGHILLIDGADELPSWVDDEIGVQGMMRRVYVIEGMIYLIPPTVQTAIDTATTTTTKKSSHLLKTIKGLTRKESLLALVNKTENQMLHSCSYQIYKRLNECVSKRFSSFTTIINYSNHNNYQNSSPTRTTSTHVFRDILKEHLHTTAIVLPLEIARLIHQRPDLIPSAIVTFCHFAPHEILDKKMKKSLKRTQNHRNDVTNTTTAAATTTTSSSSTFLFENLVFTTITISKTLYSMLLTAAGQLFPPIPIPRHYKSVELNRIKRQFLTTTSTNTNTNTRNNEVDNSTTCTDAYLHFRHAVENGIRLSLGFEWILSSPSSSVIESTTSKSSRMNISNTANTTTSTTTNTTSNHLIENRVLNYSRIDVEAGGDGKWIQNVWNAGPNKVQTEDDITHILKCPVWYPEIVTGGLCPISNMGKSLRGHVHDTLKNIRKELEVQNINVSLEYPMPRMSDVDSDEWIDISFDELEEKMNKIIQSNHSDNLSPTEKDVPQQPSSSKQQSFGNTNKVDAVWEGIQSFVEGKSGIAGVEIQRAGHKSLHDEVSVNPRVFLNLLYNTLKPQDENISNVDNRNSSVKDDDDELLKYFSKRDLYDDSDNDSCIDDDMEDNESGDEDLELKQIMLSMDEEIKGENLDRNYSSVHNNDIMVEELQTMKNHRKEDIPMDKILLQQNEEQLDENLSCDIMSLSNLLESLTTEGGGRGPLSTMLAGMGVEKPF